MSILVRFAFVIHAVIYICYWLTVDSADTSIPAVSVTLTRPLQQQTARCTTAREARHGEGIEALWPLESAPSGDGRPCWLQNAPSDCIYFLIRNSSYRAPFASLISELPVDTVHRMQLSQMADQPDSPLSYFTSGEWNISQLRRGLFAPRGSNTYANGVVTSNTPNSSKHIDGEKVKLSVMIAKTVVDITWWRARISQLCAAMQRLGPHMLRVESLYYEKLTFSIPIRISDPSALEEQLLRDARKYFAVATHPPLVQETAERRLVCPSLIEHTRLFNDTLVDFHCLGVNSHTSQCWNLVLSLFGYDTVSEARITAQHEVLPDSPIDANAKYECTLYRRAAASPMCLSLLSFSESGLEVAMTQQLTIDWVFFAMLSAVIGLEVVRRRTMRLHLRLPSNALEAHVYPFTVIRSVSAFFDFRWWHFGVYFCAVELIGLTYPLTLVCIMLLLRTFFHHTILFCWDVDTTAGFGILLWSIWALFLKVINVFQCVLLSFLYLSNPEAFVLAASYSASGLLVIWIWSNLAQHIRRCTAATDEIGDPEDDGSARERASRYKAVANAVVKLRGNSVAARKKQYKDSGDYHTRKALEELAATIRSNPWKYAQVVNDPKHMLRFAFDGLDESVKI